ncbi:MAG TPA: aminoglycoside adenylyltransferase domain-containing protein [Acidimicrobiales bacterium]|nr:aminoglycoside adenylyltransferase domain-containing protein [Acidimicrobiales bacterium]
MRARPSGLSLSELPTAAASTADHLHRSLSAILGDDLVAMWVDGGTTFPDRPLVPGDLDVVVVVDRLTADERDPDRWSPEPDSRPARVVAAQLSAEAEHQASIDASYLVLGEMGGHERPGDAFFSARRHNRWPVVRAHWLAGQYVHLHGRHPEELVVAPREEDLRRALSREVEHLERHVYEGDAADPYEATYAMFSGCRVLYTLVTGNPVISKRSAGAWGLGNLPERWHPAIRAAGRSYDGEGSDEDRDLLRKTMPPFFEMVRHRLPLDEPRPAGQVPRWG